jgi:hypothetical protein
MALIDLKSNLKKSNVYKDTPGGGNSGLPYIKQGLPEDSPAGEYLASIAGTSIDTDVRGGLYSTIASTADTIRVSRFLNDFPQGSAFTSKQVGLQKSNPLIETERRGDVINTQVYSNSNLLAQVALQGTGQHVPRPGFNTNDLLRDENKYEKIVVKNNNDGQNRLVTLYNNKISTDPNSNNLTTDLDKLGISNDENTLFNYVGGPGSSYGLGNTFISRDVNTKESFETYKALGYSIPGYTPVFKTLSQDAPYSSSSIATKWNTPNDFLNIKNIRDDFNFEDSTAYQQSNSDFIRPEKVPEGMSPVNQFGNTMAYSALLNSKVGELQDFRKNTIEPNTLALNYSSSLVNIENRLQLGNPGARKKDQRKYINQINNGLGQDKINLLSLYSSEVDPIQANSVRDMIKFCIEVMDNDNVNSTVPLHFRAYITNISDNIGAEWDSKRYMGRGENFYSYQGFNREVSFNLKVAAQSKQEMMPLYQKLNYLASSLMPDYSGDGFMRGNLHKLTIGEWFYRTPGVLKSMNVSIENDYSWEIKFTEPETRTFGANDFQKKVNEKQHKDKANKAEGSSDFQNSNSDADMMELPQMLSINFTFSPILNNLPRLAKKDGLFTQTPILISDHGDKENFIKRIVN